MQNSKILVYDGSFNGFLTCIYLAFEKHWTVTDIKKNGVFEDELFLNVEYIKTDTGLAKKVWYGLDDKNKSATKKIYFSFLSEQKDIEILLFGYVQFIMGKALQENESNIDKTIEMLNVLMNKVEKEKRRMEVFADFQLAEENSSLAILKPKYNVLPLLSRHLRQIQKVKQWQVFDEKRKYGISYSYGKLEIASGKANVRLAV